MRQTLSLLSLAFAISSVCSALAQEPEPQTADRAAILAAVESYVTAYNRGDAQAVAELWSDSGQWIGPTGERIQGREAIEQRRRSQ